MRKTLTVYRNWKHSVKAMSEYEIFVESKRKIKRICHCIMFYDLFSVCWICQRLNYSVKFNGILFSIRKTKTVFLSVGCEESYKFRNRSFKTQQTYSNMCSYFISRIFVLSVMKIVLKHCRESRKIFLNVVSVDSAGGKKIRIYENRSIFANWKNVIRERKAHDPYAVKRSESRTRE